MTGRARTCRTACSPSARLAAAPASARSGASGSWPVDSGRMSGRASRSVPAGDHGAGRQRRPGRAGDGVRAGPGGLDRALDQAGREGAGHPHADAHPGGGAACPGVLPAQVRLPGQQPRPGRAQQPGQVPPQRRRPGRVGLRRGQDRDLPGGLRRTRRAAGGAARPGPRSRRSPRPRAAARPPGRSAPGRTAAAGPGAPAEPPGLSRYRPAGPPRRGRRRAGAGRRSGGMSQQVLLRRRCRCRARPAPGSSRLAGLHPGDLGRVARAEEVLGGRGEGLERHPGGRPGGQQSLAAAGGQQQLPLPGATAGTRRRPCRWPGVPGGAGSGWRSWR